MGATHATGLRGSHINYRDVMAMGPSRRHGHYVAAPLVVERPENGDSPTLLEGTRRQLPGPPIGPPPDIPPPEYFHEEDMELLAKAQGLSVEQYSAQVAGGKVVSLLMNKDMSECRLVSSVFDAAIVMPQICRSADDPRSLFYLSIRAYVYVFLSLFLQVFVLYMIGVEEDIMDRYAGQMHLCDFGAGMPSCPDGPNCIGPSGTNYGDAGRLKPFDNWVTRDYFRSSILQLFPNRTEEILSEVDPGEYGVENYWVRYICIFIFMMSVLSDLRSTIDMCYIVYYAPSSDIPWLEFRLPEWTHKDHVRDVFGLDEIEFVKFKVGGMTKFWKAINTIFIILPKLLIWRLTVESGVSFLMETSQIQGVIVNVTALSFILNLDEMIFQAFVHKGVQHILANMEPLLLQEEEGEDHTMEEARACLEKDKHRRCFDTRFTPVRAILMFFLCVLFIVEYYMKYCKFNSRGGFVSREERSLSGQMLYNPLAMLFPGLIAATSQEGDVYWEFQERPD